MVNLSKVRTVIIQISRSSPLVMLDVNGPGTWLSFAREISPDIILHEIRSTLPTLVSLELLIIDIFVASIEAARKRCYKIAIPSHRVSGGY